MRFIDFHCDTVDQLISHEGSSLFRNDFSVDIERLKKGEAKGQFFALFIQKERHQSVYDRCQSMYEKLINELKNNQEQISLAASYKDFKKNEEDDKISAFISIEEGGAIEGSIDKLEEFYNKGVRLITLTWNFENELGYPNAIKGFMDKGLKSFGIETVTRMNELGMIIDVSHLSDGGFWDVVKHSQVPFVASHSNARSIKSHPRNLTDKMIKALSNKGGIMGLNFCSAFLGTSSVARLEDMVFHLKHIRHVGGVDVIALGSDFDGIGNKVEINDCSEMGKLSDVLLKEGFSYDEVEKIFYKNAERVIKDVLK